MTQIYHNPRCSKSRETLALLTERGLSPQIVLYLQQPPTPSQIKILLQQLGFADPRLLMRTKEAVYQTLGLAEQSGDTLIEAMHKNPILIERPIVVHQGQARLGRPPQQVLEILS